MFVMTSNEWVSQRIKTLCNQHNVSINKLALNACLTQSTLNSIIQGESKNPKISTLAKIANAFGLTLSELLAGIEQETDILE